MTTEFLDCYGMLPPGTKVLAALSGGKDSVYLLHRLLELAPERDLTVGAAHFDHMLRGEESRRDAQFVADLCRRLDVPLFTQQGNVRQYAEARRMGIEEAARELRYDFLESVRRSRGYDVIATAHHANDQAETMLLHLIRGAGTKGLAGIPPVRGHIIRPILNIPAAEIENELTLRAIPYVEDSSNQDDSYSRNRLRHQVVPVLESLNPQFARHAADAAESLREDDACLQAMAEDFLSDRYKDGTVPAKELRALPRPVAVRVLRVLCGPSLTRRHADALLDLCTGTERKHADLPGRRVTFQQGRLYFEPRETAPVPTIELAGERGACTAGAWRISWEMRRVEGEIHSSFNTFLLKCEKIQRTVYITGKRDGDRIRLSGRNCTKTLKALFRERGLTPEQRQSLPVLRDDAGVLAIPGFGMDERVLPQPGDKVIAVTCEESKKIGG